MSYDPDEEEEAVEAEWEQKAFTWIQSSGGDDNTDQLQRLLDNGWEHNCISMVATGFADRAVCFMLLDRRKGSNE